MVFKHVVMAPVRSTITPAANGWIGGQQTIQLTNQAVIKNFTCHGFLTRDQASFYMLLAVAGPADVVDDAAGSDWSLQATWDKFSNFTWVKQKGVLCADVPAANRTVENWIKFDMTTVTQRTLGPNDEFAFVFLIKDANLSTVSAQTMSWLEYDIQEY